MRVAHFSDVHVLSLKGTRPRQFLNKRWTGAVNLALNRAKHYRVSVFEQLLAAGAKSVTYPRVGDRRLVCDIIAAAKEILSLRYPSVAFATYAMAGGHQVETQKEHVTVFVALKFDHDGAPDWAPINIRDDDGFRLTIGTKFAQSARGHKVPERRRAWAPILSGRTLDVPDLGVHEVRDMDKWFVRSAEVAGSGEEVAQQVANAMAAILDCLVDHR